MAHQQTVYLKPVCETFPQCSHSAPFDRCKLQENCVLQVKPEPVKTGALPDKTFL